MKKLFVLFLLGILLSFYSLSVVHAFDLTIPKEKIPPILSSLEKKSYKILSDTESSVVRGQRCYQMVGFRIPLGDYIDPIELSITGVNQTYDPNQYRYGNWGGGPGYSNDDGNYSWIDTLDHLFKFHDQSYDRSDDVAAVNNNLWGWADIRLDADIALINGLASLGQNGNYISKDSTASKNVDITVSIPLYEKKTTLPLSELARIEAILAFTYQAKQFAGNTYSVVGWQRLQSFNQSYNTAIASAKGTISLPWQMLQTLAAKAAPFIKLQ